MMIGTADVFEAERYARPDGTRLYEVMVDRNGLVRCCTSGFWTMPEAELYLGVLYRCFASTRAGYGRLRALIDLRDANVQTPEVAARFGDTSDPPLFRTEDRIAFVVASTLKAMQLRRNTNRAGTMIFVSIDDAKTWLLD